MNRFTVAFFISLAIIFFSSCEKDNVQDELPGLPPVVGIPVPAGIPDGKPIVNKTIGADGGIISSSDGRMKITIPAGAFTADQQVSIQSVSNTNPLPVNEAYRITPLASEFNKPVTIEFLYTEAEVSNTVPEALGIAVHDAKGIWQVQGGAQVNKNNRSVKVTAIPAGDLSLFQSIYLYTSATVVPVGGISELDVSTVEDLEFPLVPGQQAPMGKKVSMAAKYIKEWKLAGAGSLQANAEKATYKAPATVPQAPNPVAVSVSLDINKRGKFLLVSHIRVADDDGEIEVRVAGNGWLKKTASRAVRLSNGYYSIADSDGDTEGSYVVIRWTGELGLHAYKSPYVNTGTYVHYLREGANNYVCNVFVGNQLVASGGGVTITSMGNDDGFIKGTFSIEPAGYGDNLTQTIGVEGKFRVRKGW